MSLTIPLSGDNWSDVYGVTGAADPTGFAAALAHAGPVGMTFGGGCFFGHGAYVTSGAATFVLKSYVINPKRCRSSSLMGLLFDYPPAMSEVTALGAELGDV